ncbi:MAG: CPBP family intramembrane metalloprotease [Candidatus Marinimicrobia bacterium]|nr:CPBP family intramembrane metalloprotease [Candidatus Neomarinimicrobiota bacterium]
MPKILSPLQQYLSSSRTIHYSLILTLPLVAIYEIGILIIFRDSFFELRNSGEILVRNLFTYLGLTDPSIISGLLVTIFLVVMIRGYQIEKKPGLQANFFIYMLLESMLWGGLLYVVMQLFTRLPLQIISFEDKLANLNLALGAGIFEELIFRMIVISALLVVLEQGLSIPEGWSISFAIFISAGIFAAFHLLMEPYSLPIFAQRVFAGILLGILYRYRGYGVNVYAHVVYNILILAGTW